MVVRQNKAMIIILGSSGWNQRFQYIKKKLKTIFWIFVYN